MRALLLIILLLPACTVHPFLRSGDTVVSLGGSIFTKSTGEKASYAGPLGSLSYANTGRDETVIPGKIANYYGLKAVANAATSMLRTTESTKRVLGAQSVEKAGIQSAERTESLRILNPVEEEILPVTEGAITPVGP